MGDLTTPAEPLPRRLRDFIERVRRGGRDELGDWQLARRGSLTVVCDASEADLVIEAEKSFRPFAGSFSGGVLTLDVSAADIERSPVVYFDSEGGITVLGESFDDFLAVMGSPAPDDQEAWTVDDELRDWIVASGIRPHPSAGARLTELAELTHALWSRWTASLRDVSRRLRPDEPVVHRLVVGKSLGDVTLGMPSSVLEKRWGPPDMPSWGRNEERVHAFYPGAPFSMELDPSGRRVTGIVLGVGRHQAVTDGGVEPMLMRAHDAMEWLNGGGLAPLLTTASEIRAADGTFRLSLRTSRGGAGARPWVDAISICERGRR